MFREGNTKMIQSLINSGGSLHFGLSIHKPHLQPMLILAYSKGSTILYQEICILIEFFFIVGYIKITEKKNFPSLQTLCPCMRKFNYIVNAY